MTANVDVGNVFFRSAANGSLDPAVDTIAAGGTVTWTWIEAGTHGVSFDDPHIPASADLAEAGSVFNASFATVGTFTYECTIHGSVMSGTVVVR